MSGRQRPLVSFVVPTKNSARTLEALLNSLQGQAASEVIVVDNHSTDATVEIAMALADRVLERGPERSAQRNAGADVCQSEFLCFLDSDMIADPTLAEAIAEGFAGKPRVGALVIPEEAFGDGFWASCRTLEKRLYRGDARVEAARAYRKKVFVAVGGYDEALTGGEDWDLPDRVAEAGWEIGVSAAEVRHDEGRLRLGETFRKKRYYGASVPAYLAKQRAVGRRRLNRVAFLARALRHSPRLGGGILILKSVEAVGLLVGAAEGARRRSR
jgi:glycosyltransferase involved in cell wall biosynthesis